MSGASISSVSGSGDTYIVTVNTGTDSGTIQLNVIDNDNIEDINGNYFDSPFSAGEVYSIEKIASTAASENFIVTFYKSVIDFFQRIFRTAPVDNK